MAFIFPRPQPFSALTPLFNPTRSSICAQCRRSFAANAVLSSGHNKWSKIKHDKAVVDRKKNTKRSFFSNQLTLSSKLYGADPNLNTRLASLIATAKKAGMPKATIDVAIARGQGKSETGAGLESATLEVMLAPSIAMIIDIESDHKDRALKDLRPIIKKHGATVTTTAFLFTKQGRVELGPGTSEGEGEDENTDAATNKRDEEQDPDDIMMRALDAGAEDVDMDGGRNVVLWTQPNLTHQVAQDAAKALNMNILSSDIIWTRTSESVKVDDLEQAITLGKLLTAIRDYRDVQAIYINAERGDVPEETWNIIDEALES